MLVTHNPDLAARYASRTIELVDGRIAGAATRDLQRGRGMSGAAILRAVRGGIARRRLQTGVVALVVLISTASTVVALALVVNSEAPFDHAFATQRGADIVATIAPNVGAASLARTAHVSGVTAAAGPYGEVTVTGTSDGMQLRAADPRRPRDSRRRRSTTS